MRVCLAAVLFLALAGCRGPQLPPPHEPADDTVRTCIAAKRFLRDGKNHEQRPTLEACAADLRGLSPAQVKLLLGKPWKKHGVEVWEYRGPCWGTCCGVIALAWSHDQVSEVFDSRGFEPGFGGEAARYGEFLERHGVAAQ